MDENAVRLERIFEGIFWTDPGPVTRKTRENTASWDSLAHLSLVLSIEQEFGIALADDELLLGGEDEVQMRETVPTGGILPRLPRDRAGIGPENPFEDSLQPDGVLIHATNALASPCRRGPPWPTPRWRAASAATVRLRSSRI